MKRLITMLACFYSINAFSGDPGGISLYVKPLASAIDYKYVIDGFFRNYYGVDNANTPTCNSNDYTPFIDNVYLNSNVKGIDNQDLLQAIHSRDSRMKIAKVLSEFKDDRVSGFDGIMFYELKNDEVIIYTFDSKDFIAIYTTKVKVEDLISKKILGETICKSISSKILPPAP
ncbi:hypothetical protein [Nissabacter sp. SGAir0207]|uniref:hypothetical protein n=1 Tax=Nissabacter sp. SGAir0207 TaxID=2126321 RepID=UPI0010CD0DBC|nr:hypothetical protein [Nissabacter sp. SGAir0207]QCR36845.1 hypothetical protein C1N62_12470 [Nissabacter sp. SGAir0207]